MIQRQLTINATPEAIWAIVSDLQRGPAWMPDITQRVLETDRPAGIGARWREHGLLRGKPYSTVYEITEWLPPHRLAYRRAAVARGDYRWIESIHIEAAGAGAQVTAGLDYEMPGGLIGRLYDRFLFRKDFSLTLDNRLERLKELLESEQSNKGAK